jgi:PST family polysaccharide transporter
MRGSAIRQEAASLLKLGFAFMASGFLMMGAAYAVRTMVLHLDGLEAAGFYQAAWTLGGLYVGIILQAMGTDFYPRLVGVATDNQQCNRLVNEQAHVSLLLAGPGVIATLAFAPLVIALLYTAKFNGGVEVLRWICLGIALRVITWPMGFIIVAKNNPALFIGTELAWTISNVGLTWLCVNWFGLSGAGIAFLGSYILHGLMIYPIVRWLSGFRWSTENGRLSLLFLCSIVVVFCGFYVLPAWLATTVGTLATVLSSVHALRVLINLAPSDRVPKPILQLVQARRSSRCL